LALAAAAAKNTVGLRGKYRDAKRRRIVTLVDSQLATQMFQVSDGNCGVSEVPCHIHDAG
jgi:hypothetical protein